MNTIKFSVENAVHMPGDSLFSAINSSLPKEMKKELLAKYIREKMQKARLRSNDFADKVNKRPSEITKWLSGNHNFTVETLFEIEEKLGIKIINLSEPPIKKTEDGAKRIQLTVTDVKQNILKRRNGIRISNPSFVAKHAIVYRQVLEERIT
jgi:transcriptional regulator with XRE-family HTH domain